MGFQHTFYLKRNEDTLNDDNLDGITYRWQCGARDFSDTVRRFGTVEDKLPNGYVTFKPVQLLRLISAIGSELYGEYRILKDGYYDFVENVVYSDPQGHADKLALDSYAIWRSAYKELSELEPRTHLDGFEEPHKMTNILTGLYSIVETMRDDDILVWKLSC